jgi:hypothetical protein
MMLSNVCFENVNFLEFEEQFLKCDSNAENRNKIWRGNHTLILTVPQRRSFNLYTLRSHPLRRDNANAILPHPIPKLLGASDDVQADKSSQLAQLTRLMGKSLVPQAPQSKL